MAAGDGATAASIVAPDTAAIRSAWLGESAVTSTGSSITVGRCATGTPSSTTARLVAAGRVRTPAWQGAERA